MELEILMKMQCNMTNLMPVSEFQFQNNIP